MQNEQTSGSGTAPGNGGVRSPELSGTPAASGAVPPSGWPTGSPLRVVESAT